MRISTLAAFLIDAAIAQPLAQGGKDRAASYQIFRQWAENL